MSGPSDPTPTAGALAETPAPESGSWKLPDNLPALPKVGIDIVTLGRLLVASGFFEDTKKLSQAVVKVLKGQELEIGPVTAMEQIHIIAGRPALSAALVAALIKRSGRYNFLVTEIDDTKCVLTFTDGGQEVGKSSFTIDEATRAGLTNRTQSWKIYPSDMLFARALTRGARRFCADVFGGAVYTPEELAEVEPAPTATAATRP